MRAWRSCGVLTAVAVAGLVLAGCGSSSKAAAPVAHPSSTAAPSPSARPGPTTTRPPKTDTTTSTRPAEPVTTATPTTATTATPTTAASAPPATSTAPTSTAPASTAPTSTAPTSTEGASTTSSTVAPTTAESTTTVAGAPVKVIADCQSAAYEPTTIILACGDGGVSATLIAWNSWGPTTATGTAVIRANLCNPNCAQGSTGSFPAAITLSGVIDGPSGQVFSTMTADYSGASPNGGPTETFSLSGQA